MGYAARICHQTDARIRFQLLEVPPDWQKLLVKIQEQAPKLAVRVNTATRSLVLQSQEPELLGESIHRIAEAGVLELIPKSPPRRSWDFPMQNLHERTDRFIREVSGERLDFRSAFGYAMFGLGIRQSWSAKFLPAGLTLMMYAATFLDRPRPEGSREI